MFGFTKEKPKTTTVVVDLDGVLLPSMNSFDQPLLEKLNEFKKNGIEIYVCSTGYNGLINELMRRSGLDLDLDKSWLEGTGSKSEKSFWKELVKNGRLPPGTVFLDDNAHNCKAAESAGLTAMKWNSRDPDRIRKLEAALQP